MNDTIMQRRNIARVIAEMEAQRDKMNNAIDVLRELYPTAAVVKRVKASPVAEVLDAEPKRKQISAAARKKLSVKLKAYWARRRAEKAAAMPLKAKSTAAGRK